VPRSDSAWRARCTAGSMDRSQQTWKLAVSNTYQRPSRYVRSTWDFDAHRHSFPHCVCATRDRLEGPKSIRKAKIAIPAQDPNRMLQCPPHRLKVNGRAKARVVPSNAIINSRPPG
jgi:hypothetical protein